MCNTSITIDHREIGSLYIHFLHKIKEISLFFQPLKAGDILIDNLIIERKLLPDLYLTMKEGRLFKQLKKLKYSYPRQLLIIEGVSDKNSLQYSNMQGVYARITAGWQIPIIHTPTPKDTARLIWRILHQTYYASAGPIMPRPRSKQFHDLPIEQKMLLQIPGIGYKKAEVLFRHFGSLSKILNASSQELRKVPGIGKKRANLISNLF